MAMKTKKPCPHCDHVRKQVEKFKIELTACICGQSFELVDNKAKKISHSEALKKIQ